MLRVATYVAGITVSARFRKCIFCAYAAVLQLTKTTRTTAAYILIMAGKANMVTMTKLDPITKYYSKHGDNQNR